MSWMKIAGIADGVLLAAVTALGQAMPAWQTYTQSAVEVLGVLGTVLAGISSQSPSPPPASNS